MFSAKDKKYYLSKSGRRNMKKYKKNENQTKNIFRI
jgi:hypothetical protein